MAGQSKSTTPIPAHWNILCASIAGSVAEVISTKLVIYHSS
jgi:hypothetical protein